VELSVVLVNHNGADCLPAALDALARNTVTEDVEALVVDSGSSDGSWKRVERHWSKTHALRFEENIGFCRGCNRGAEAAAGRNVAFVNFDAEVEHEWDAPLLRLLRDRDISIVTGLLLRTDGVELEAAGLEIAPNFATFGRLEGEPRSTAPVEPFDVTAASGALMMVRRDEFLALGGFYEPLFMYGEEADYCLRVGGRIVVHPGSAARHRQGHASGQLRSQTRLYWPSRNRLILAARHLSLPSLVKSVAASGAFDLATLVQVRSRERASAMARGWIDGVRSMPAERRARSRAERRLAATRLVSFRDALRQQRRLGRV
jgi:N-acetylglucosaminyl-diphospho-decaprenol L-rhamnosyltransferase